MAKEKAAEDILKGLVKEVRALYKEVAFIKETYAKRLRKGLPSLSSPPLLLSPSATPSLFSRVTSVPNPTFTKNKTKQL